MTTALDTPTLKPIEIARRLDKHPSAITRWIIKGAALRDGSRIFLEAVRTPGGWNVAPAAMEAFLARLTEDARGRAPRPAIDQAEHAAASAALEAAGW
jgi:hypothetical protein